MFGFQPIKKILKKHWSLFLLLVVFGWLFFGLLSSHMLLEKSDGLYAGGSTWGDIALHTSIISSFNERGFLPSLKNFIVYPDGERLRYPFVMDLISSGLMKMGFSMQSALIWPSFLLILALISVIYFLVLKIIKSRLAATLAPPIFLLNFSIFGLNHIAKQSIRFSSIISDFILPQRAIILGLVFGLLVIYFLWQYWEEKNKKSLLWSGIIFSCLPFIHTHTFLSLAMAIFGLIIIDFVVNLKDWKTILKNWLFFVGPTIILSLPQVFWLFPFGQSSFFRINWGWMADKENIFIFWLKNLGLHWVALISGFWFVSKKIKLFYLPFLGLFVVSNIFAFQPNLWDNSKILIWWFLMSIVLMAGFFDWAYEKYKRKSLFVLIPFFISLVLVGGILIAKERNISWLLFNKNDLAIAEFVKYNTEKDSLFLTTDHHNNPITCLAGRKILMGYRGWIWSYGIDYYKREADIFDIYHGELNALDLINKYQIDYIVIDNDKVAEWEIDVSFFYEQTDIFGLIYQNDRYMVFRVN